MRYIVFLIDTRFPQYLDGRLVDVNSGYVFKKLEDAKEYALENRRANECDKWVIGCFVEDPDRESTGISSMETYGFKNSKKNPQQLELWRNI